MNTTLGKPEAATKVYLLLPSTFKSTPISAARARHRRISPKVTGSFDTREISDSLVPTSLYML